MKKVLQNIFLAICIVVFCFSSYKLYEVWKTQNQVKEETSSLSQYLKPAPAPAEPAAPEESAEDSTQSAPAQKEEAKPERLVYTPDWAGLQAQNPDILGWIIVPGTNISYPVVQGKDNVWYLTHTAMGESNYIGAVFMDATAPRDFSDSNTIIFAHSVDIGGMFTDLDKFEDKAFFENHPVFWLLTPEQNYQCKIFAFTEANPSSAIYTVDYGDYAKEVLQEVKDQALYYRDEGDLKDKHLVSLSTCNLDYGFNSNQRLVLSAVLDKYNEPVYADMVEN